MFLVVQWLRLSAPNAGSLVWSLVRDLDPTCHTDLFPCAATKIQHSWKRERGKERKEKSLALTRQLPSLVPFKLRSQPSLFLQGLSKHLRAQKTSHLSQGGALPPLVLTQSSASPEHVLWPGPGKALGPQRGPGLARDAHKHCLHHYPASISWPMRKCVLWLE